METIWLIFLLMIGACVGSFLNVVIYRLPRRESIIFPPSHCPNCGRGIKFYDNIPLVSWLMLRGKCRFCKMPISPRYLAIEAATAGLVGGLYICYYMLEIRQGVGPFSESWPMFAAHAALLCCLLVCTVVDLETWTIPLEVCWVVSLVGIISSGVSPHKFMPPISPVAGAVCLGAAAGLAIALTLKHFGLIRDSFIDASDKPMFSAEDKAEAKQSQTKPAPFAIAATKAHGVNPRKEVLIETAFLAPAIVLAIAAGLLVTKVPAIANFWNGLFDISAEGISGKFAIHFTGVLAAMLGYFVGAAWIWGMRIFGTLAFGKEAMGLGDVHILGAVGAVCGWVVPSLAFFLAPIFGLVWALRLWLGKGQRELPYGPWLAAGTGMVILFYDGIIDFLGPLADALGI